MKFASSSGVKDRRFRFHRCRCCRRSSATWHALEIAETARKNFQCTMIDLCCYAGLYLVAVGACSGRHLRLVRAVEEGFSAAALLPHQHSEQAVAEGFSAVALLRHQHLEQQVRPISSLSLRSRTFDLVEWAKHCNGVFLLQLQPEIVHMLSPLKGNDGLSTCSSPCSVSGNLELA